MSLVFLKNRDAEISELSQEGRPAWKWNNTFNSPLKLPPNSQVAYIQSTIALGKAMSLTNENDVLYLCWGNPEINPTMRIPLPQGQPQSPAALAAIINTQLNNWGLQADIKTTEQSVSNGVATNLNGFMCLYDPLTLKFNYAVKQRPTNTTKEVGYNVSRSGSILGYTGVSQLDLIRTPGFSGWNNPPIVNGLGLPILDNPTNYIPMTWLPPFFFNGTGTPNIADVGFNVIRGASGGPLPTTNANATIPVPGNPDQAYFPYSMALQNNYGSPDNPVQNTWGMWSSKTGIKKSGLSGGTPNPTDLNEILFLINDNPSAHAPAIANNRCMPILACLCPRYWLEYGGANNPYLVDTGRKTHLNSVDLNTGNVDAPGKGKARGLFGIRMLTPNTGGGGLAGINVGKIQAFMNIGTYDAPQYTDLGVPCDIAPLPTAGADPAGQTAFKFTCINSYQFAVWVCRDYNQAIGQGTWTKIYDMSDGSDSGAGGGSTMLIPSWFGDLCLVNYTPYKFYQARVRGNFDVIQSFTGSNSSDGSVSQPFPLSTYQPAMFSRWGMIRTGGGNFTGSIENNAANGFAEKTMSITHNPSNAVADLDFNLNIPQFPLDVFGQPQAGYTYPLDPSIDKYFTLGSPNTSLGYELGFGSDAVEDLITGVPTPFEMYKAVASQPLQTSRNINSIHIQLTNLPIQSKNAIIQSSVKDIAVVPCYDAQKVNDDAVNSIEIYHHQNSVKNWIDLNNIQTLYLNNLDVYLSYDNNKPATGVKDETDILVMFRQKPATDLSTPLNIQTLNQQNPFTNRIQEI